MSVLVQHQVNLRGKKKLHDAIRDMMATSSRVFFLLSLAGVPNGYMAVGYLLFLQEQIKGIIILLELRQGGLHQILELLSFLQARHFGRVSAFGILQEKRL